MAVNGEKVSLVGEWVLSVKNLKTIKLLDETHTEIAEDGGELTKERVVVSHNNMKGRKSESFKADDIWKLKFTFNKWSAEFLEEMTEAPTATVGADGNKEYTFTGEQAAVPVYEVKATKVNPRKGEICEIIFHKAEQIENITLALKGTEYAKLVATFEAQELQTESGTKTVSYKIKGE